VTLGWQAPLQLLCTAHAGAKDSTLKPDLSEFRLFKSELMYCVLLHRTEVNFDVHIILPQALLPHCEGFVYYSSLLSACDRVLARREEWFGVNRSTSFSTQERVRSAFVGAFLLCCFSETFVNRVYFTALLESGLKFGENFFRSFTFYGWSTSKCHVGLVGRQDLLWDKTLGTIAAVTNHVIAISVKFFTRRDFTRTCSVLAGNLYTIFSNQYNVKF